MGCKPLDTFSSLCLLPWTHHATRGHFVPMIPDGRQEALSDNLPSAPPRSLQAGLRFLPTSGWLRWGLATTHLPERLMSLSLARWSPRQAARPIKRRKRATLKSRLQIVAGRDAKAAQRDGGCLSSGDIAKELGARLGVTPAAGAFPEPLDRKAKKRSSQI